MPTPTLLTVLSDIETPVSLFEKLSQQEPMAFLYESTETDSRLARYSFIGLDPVKRISFADGAVTVEDTLEGTIAEFPIENPLAFLSQLMEEENAKHPERAAMQAQVPFVGGLVGYLGYGATHSFEKIPGQSADPFQVPDGFYGLYDTVVFFDHMFRTTSILSFRGEAYARKLLERLMAPAVLPPLFFERNLVSEDAIFEAVTGPLDEVAYCDVVRKAKEYIQEGQVFQIVPAHRFSRSVTAPPLNIYRLLQAINPSPYAYYLKFPDFTYLGSSPETFVQCRDGHVVLRALAGTRARGLTDAEDLKLAEELRSNEKELAEHHMLVDLGRNDLGRVCQPGSIRVGEIATLTRYTHVMHLATELSGTLRDDKTAYQVCQSCFPRGTVSGAPKIRAMQLLSELEPERRGIYSGFVGYFDYAGNMDGAIAIRSVLVKDGQAHVQAGAGVVYDSDPLMEYHETRNKAKSVLKAVQLAEKLAQPAGEVPCPL